MTYNIDELSGDKLLELLDYCGDSERNTEAKEKIIGEIRRRLDMYQEYRKLYSKGKLLLRSNVMKYIRDTQKSTYEKNYERLGELISLLEDHEEDQEQYDQDDEDDIMMWDNLINIRLR